MNAPTPDDRALPGCESVPPLSDDERAELEARIESKTGLPPRPSSLPLIVRFTPAMRCDHDALNIEDCTETWGQGWCCRVCGRPVAIRITHYGSAIPSVLSGGQLQEPNE